MSTCLRAFSSFTTLVHDVYARVDQVRNTPYGCHAITVKAPPTEVRGLPLFSA